MGAVIIQVLQDTVSGALHETSFQELVSMLEKGRQPVVEIGPR